MARTNTGLSVAEALDSFTLYLRAKNRADKTIRSFSESVRSLADWLDDNSVDDDVAAITRQHVCGSSLAFVSAASRHPASGCGTHR